MLGVSVGVWDDDFVIVPVDELVGESVLDGVFVFDGVLVFDEVTLVETLVDFVLLRELDTLDVNVGEGEYVDAGSIFKLNIIGIICLKM